MSARISQREARRLRHRVRELEHERERQRAAWAVEWPGGEHVGSVTPGVETLAAVRTARKLRHAVVAVVVDGNLHFYALPLPKVTDQ